MNYKFREHNPVRSCIKKYKNYHNYKKYLCDDFNGHCAYCNLSDKLTLIPFEIDHFIPKDEFQQVWPELLTTYENLVYSCKKCNRAKGNKYKGELSHRKITNDLFYDPVKTDYNSIFYRNDDGAICSDDKKGRNMITMLNLYKPVHSIAWMWERINLLIDKISLQMELFGDTSPKYKKLQEAKYRLMEIERDCREYFIYTYND